MRLIKALVAYIWMFILIGAVLIVVICVPILFAAGLWFMICLIGGLAFTWSIPIFIGLVIAMSTMITVR